MLSAKQAEMVIAVRPVRPPSLMPTADSVAMISGVVPVIAPSAVPNAADRYVTTVPGTAPSRTRPARLPVESRDLVREGIKVKNFQGHIHGVHRTNKSAVMSCS